MASVAQIDHEEIRRRIREYSKGNERCSWFSDSGSRWAFFPRKIKFDFVNFWAITSKGNDHVSFQKRSQHPQSSGPYSPFIFKNSRSEVA